MKSTLNIVLAGLLALGSTALPTEQPVTKILRVIARNPAEFDGKYLCPGIKVDGDTLIDLTPDSPRYFYVDPSNSQLVMKGDTEIVGNAWIDTENKGILRFSQNSSREYGQFGISPDTGRLSLLGASDRWYWCPVEGQNHGTLAISTTDVGMEGCVELNGIQTSATD